MKTKVSVLLIRENAEQLTGSGCCGKLEGNDPLMNNCELFGESRQHQVEMGVLHRTIRKFFPAVEGKERVSVVTIDPRNQLYLIAKLCHDICCYRPGLLEGLRSALQIFSLPAVIVNGRVISRRGKTVDPDSLCHKIGEEL